MDSGRISRPHGPITARDWHEVVLAHPAFEPMQDRQGAKPFTGEPIVFPGEGKVFYVVDGERRGNAVLEDGDVLTTGVPATVCAGLAAELGAVVSEDAIGADTRHG